MHAASFPIPRTRMAAMNQTTNPTSHRMFIGGEWLATEQTLPVVDPATGAVVGSIPRGGAAEIDAAVRAGRAALAGAWGAVDATGRGRLLLRLAELIRRDADILARIESADVGKPLGQARGDAAAFARYFEYYGGAADKVHGETIPFLQGYTVMTVYEPIGVTGHIIPWNYPMQIMGRSVAAALAMGNAVVLKPAEDTSLSSLHLARLAEEAGFPAGAFNVVTGLGEEAGAALAGHPGIGHVSFTGSPEVGALVQAAAGRNSVPVTLELGGKSPQVVFADAPMEEAAATITRGISQNSGQTCSAGSRVLIEDRVYDSFTQDLAARFRALRVGTPDQELDCGPVVNAAQQQRIQRYLDMARRDGLPVLAEGSLAGNVPPGGYYVKPVLIGDVPAEHPLAQEEIFGPVLVAIRVRDEADALRVANATAYGLVAGVWTADIARALRLARGISAGQVFINNFGAAGGIELPFGGTRRSGHGREKGFEALYGFASLKTIAIKHGI